MSIKYIYMYIYIAGQSAVLPSRVFPVSPSCKLEEGGVVGKKKAVGIGEAGGGIQGCLNALRNRKKKKNVPGTCQVQGCLNPVRYHKK